MAKKKPAKKKITKKSQPKKAASKKKASKKKAIKKGKPRNLLATEAASPPSGRPVCKTQQIFLGDCMPWAQAIAVAKQHESNHPLHVVDVEAC